MTKLPFAADSLALQRDIADDAWAPIASGDDARSPAFDWPHPYLPAAAAFGDLLAAYQPRTHDAGTLFLSSHEVNAASAAPQALLPGGGSGTIETVSPTMDDEMAFICGVAAGGEIVGTSFWTWNSNNPATYAASSNAHKWGGTAPGTAGGTVDYYFDPASSWTATEKAQMTACIKLWGNLVNVNFVLTTNAAAADITLHRGNDGSAVTPASWSGGGGAGTVGGSHLWTMTSAEVSIDTTVPGFGPMDGDFTSIGGYVWMTIEHELGHAIGLGHAGAYNGSVDSSTQQYSAFDSRLWSIMSYIDPDDSSAKFFSQYTVTGTNWGTAADGYGNVPTTPMILDILAAQELYGAPSTTVFDGGQTFGFHCNIADPDIAQFYDFTKNVNPVVTIWDAGTSNTLDLSGFTQNSTIDLNPGSFSSCNGQVNNIAIAFGTEVDTADGGAGADTFIANDGNDRFNGGGRNDTFEFGATFNNLDHVNGGGGQNNVLVLDGDYSANVAFKNATIAKVQTIELTAGHSYMLTPADANLAAGQTMTVDGHLLGSSDVLTYNGVKELDGHLDLFGGAGDDALTAGSGDDMLKGGHGADKMKGGPGDDTFVYARVSDSTSTTHDSILDLDFSADKIDLWFAISGVMATINGGALSAGSFNSDLATALSSLASHKAVLFNPDSGNLAGHTILVVDCNGTAGYQAGADLVIDLNHPTHSGSFGTGTFV
ncbi:MAG TPA: M10 family metallopeptidase C-terminal domain-containing protein [Rhizomicrobium sp.]|nr:M10 family metallopeptidase C-terminal domain-containing protein [Rhizomicrobium sp.]